MGCFEGGGAVAGEVAIAEVIGHDDDNVRFPGSACWKKGEGTQGRDQRGDRAEIHEEQVLEPVGTLSIQEVKCFVTSKRKGTPREEVSLENCQEGRLP